MDWSVSNKCEKLQRNISIINGSIYASLNSTSLSVAWTLWQNVMNRLGLTTSQKKKHKPDYCAPNPCFQIALNLIRFVGKQISVRCHFVLGMISTLGTKDINIFCPMYWRVWFDLKSSSKMLRWSIKPKLSLHADSTRRNTYCVQSLYLLYVEGIVRTDW